MAFQPFTPFNPSGQAATAGAVQQTPNFGITAQFEQPKVWLPSSDAGKLDFSSIDGLLNTATNLVAAQGERKKSKAELEQKVTNYDTEIKTLSENLDKHIRALNILGLTTDDTVTKALNVITGVINKALALVFPKDPRTIKLEHVMFQKKYPHFVVTLEVGEERKKRKFTQSGTGLAQIISFLFTITLIDARKGRPIFIMDELLSGLHPIAKGLIRDMILAISGRFQFVIVEYGLDIGQQYEVVMGNDATSTVTPLAEPTYYRDLQLAGIDLEEMFGNKGGF